MASLYSGSGLLGCSTLALLRRSGDDVLQAPGPEEQDIHEAPPRRLDAIADRARKRFDGRLGLRLGLLAAAATTATDSVAAVAVARTSEHLAIDELGDVDDELLVFPLPKLEQEKALYADGLHRELCECQTPSIRRDTSLAGGDESTYVDPYFSLALVDIVYVNLFPKAGPFDQQMQECCLRTHLERSALQRVPELVQKFDIFLLGPGRNM
jgi:hypothetical protein